MYCDWANGNEKLKKYHDTEWGVPVHDDKVMFEHLMMECLQCGLSWNYVLQKRDIFRQCLDKFNFNKIAKYTDEDVDRIMNTEGMLRSRRKIEAIINNAKCYLSMRKEFGSFESWLWEQVGGATILYNHHAAGIIPASNGLSADIAKELKKRGFRYLGPTTVYAHMQACGLINDHGKKCPCRQKIIDLYPTVKKRRVDEVNQTQWN